jgi:hypothetical protein
MGRLRATGAGSLVGGLAVSMACSFEGLNGAKWSAMRALFSDLRGLEIVERPCSLKTGPMPAPLFLRNPHAWEQAPMGFFPQSNIGLRC